MNIQGVHMLGLIVYVLVGIVAIIAINRSLIKLKMKTKELKGHNGRKRDLVIFLSVAGRRFFLKRPKKGLKT